MQKSFMLKTRLNDIRAFIRTCEYKDRVCPSDDNKATISSAKALELKLSAEYIEELITSSLQG